MHDLTAPERIGPIRSERDQIEPTKIEKCDFPEARTPKVLFRSLQNFTNDFEHLCSTRSPFFRIESEAQARRVIFT